MDYLEDLREETRIKLQFGFQTLELWQNDSRRASGLSVIHNNRPLRWVYHDTLEPVLKEVVCLPSLLEQCFRDIQRDSKRTINDVDDVVRDLDERGLTSIETLSNRLAFLKDLEARARNPFRLNKEDLLEKFQLHRIGSYFVLGDPGTGVRGQYPDSGMNHPQKALLAGGIFQTLEKLEALVGKLKTALLNPDNGNLRQKTLHLIVPFVEAYQLARFCLEFLQPVCMKYDMETAHKMKASGHWSDLGFDFLAMLKQHSNLLVRRLLQLVPA